MWIGNTSRDRDLYSFVLSPAFHCSLWNPAVLGVSLNSGISPNSVKTRVSAMYPGLVTVRFNNLLRCRRIVSLPRETRSVLCPNLRCDRSRSFKARFSMWCSKTEMWVWNKPDRCLRTTMLIFVIYERQCTATKAYANNARESLSLLQEESDRVSFRWQLADC